MDVGAEVAGGSLGLWLGSVGGMAGSAELWGTTPIAAFVNIIWLVLAGVVPEKSVVHASECVHSGQFGIGLRPTAMCERAAAT